MSIVLKVRKRSQLKYTVRIAMIHFEHRAREMLPPVKSHLEQFVVVVVVVVSCCEVYLLDSVLRFTFYWVVSFTETCACFNSVALMFYFKHS